MIIDDIYVIDNAISENYQHWIERQIFHNSNMCWYLMPDVTLPVEYLEENNIQTVAPAFAHVYKDDRGIHSAWFGLVSPVALEICAKVGVPVNDILQARSFLQLPLAQQFHRPRNHIHVDQEFPHVVCLYYVTDSDGDLVIYDKCLGECDPVEINRDPPGELKRVTPKKGRAVVMDGSRYHCSSPPTQAPRLNINFNVV